MEHPKLTFGPTGTRESPKDNRIHVMLATEDGEIHLDLPAPGILNGVENVKDTMILSIMAALDQLQRALNDGAVRASTETPA